MILNQNQTNFLKNFALSRDGRLLAEILEVLANELKDPTQYKDKTGIEYEMEVKSSNKAGEKLKELIKCLRRINIESPESDINLNIRI